MCVRSFLYPFFTVINLLPHQVLSDWSQVSGPEAKLSPSDHESELFTISYQFPSLLSDPQGQKPDVGFRTFTIVQELLWYYCSPVCGSPTWQVWYLILSWLHPSYCLSGTFLSLGVGYLFFFFFGVFQHPSVNGCSTALVFSLEKISTHPFSLPS